MDLEDGSGDYDVESDSGFSCLFLFCCMEVGTRGAPGDTAPHFSQICMFSAPLQLTVALSTSCSIIPEKLST